MVQWLPTVNASLNGLAFVLLVCGYIAIRRRKVEAHKAFMLSALACSALFLACYLVYHAQVGSKKYAGPESLRTVYYVVLVPHVILAVVMLPPIAFLLRRAFKGEFEKHRRLARVTLPIWLYVSLSGVVVYWMLYHL